MQRVIGLSHNLRYRTPLLRLCTHMPSPHDLLIRRPLAHLQPRGDASDTELQSTSGPQCEPNQRQCAVRPHPTARHEIEGACTRLFPCGAGISKEWLSIAEHALGGSVDSAQIAPV